MDTCLDLHLLEGAPDPSMHQLFAAFLRETEPSDEEQAELVRVRTAQRRRFVALALAAEVEENPADAQKASVLTGYPLSSEAWAGLEQPPSILQGSSSGRALYEIGRSDDARPWFEWAVAEKEKGDTDGRIDHESLAVSLSAGAACLIELGQS